MDRFIKQPSEKIQYTFDFTPALLASDTITGISGTPTIANILGTTVGDSVPTFGVTWVVSASQGVSNFVSGGLDGYTYKATVKVTTTAGEILEHEFLIAVKEL